MSPEPDSPVIEVGVGDTFDVPLEAVPTSGFRWELSTPEDAHGVVALLKDEWEGASGSVGGPAVQRFRFRASGPGEVTLTFRYARPWEERSPREERTVTVLVAPSG
ncbi:MAG TPA: protease inhibitor I42 family protein [Gaiellaceae bacterium]|jgi:predicted secreted protein